MRRSWTTVLLGAGLLGLLALLATLQYRWLSQVSEADGEKARKRVQETADHFAEDFNREIQSAYFNFQADAQTWKKQDWTDFNERYDFWKEKTTYPGLIDEFYFLEASSNSAPTIFDRIKRSFVATELTPQLEAISTRLAEDRSFQPVDENSLSLILPIHDVGNRTEQIVIRKRSAEKTEAISLPPKYGFLIIKLDPKTIKENLLGDLVKKYYPDGEFHIQVMDKAGEAIIRQPFAGDRDARAKLFDLSPEKFMFFSNKDLMKSVDGEKKQAIVLNSRIESHSFNQETSGGDNKGSVKIEVKKESLPRTSVFTATMAPGNGDGLWILGVQHSSGSIDNYQANALRRNLSVGFGILFLLAAAVMAIIFSAQRAKMLARRQIEFVSSVSHEFRTPLAVIYSAGENLADGVAKEGEQVSRYGNLIKGEGRKLSAMVEQILDFAGANSGRRKFNLAQTSVDEIVKNALDECRPLIEQNNVAVETALSSTLPSINADKTALSQAIQNLIANSIKYNSGDAWLRISAENGNGKVKISVEDRGIGIANKDIRLIFEPFYRSKEVVDAQIHGNGLGLSLVKQIAEAHNGRVFVSSEIRKGSKFTIELPNK